MAKRKRVMAPRRNVRRRFTRKSRMPRRAIIKSYTTQSGSGGSVNFMNRRQSTRRYRNIIWNDSILKTHYRSISAQAVDQATPNNVIQSRFNRIKALENGVGLFWTVAGGAMPADGGVAVPGFGTSITLRGGVSRLTLTTNSTDDTVRVRVWAVWTSLNPSGIPAAADVPLDWDPSIIPSFRRNVGKVLFSKEAMLLPNGGGVTCTYKFRVQRIDQEVFNNNGNTLFWFYTICQTKNNDIGPLAEIVTAVSSFNVSFVGDEIS